MMTLAAIGTASLDFFSLLQALDADFSHVPLGTDPTLGFPPAGGDPMPPELTLVASHWGLRWPGGLTSDILITVQANYHLQQQVLQ